MGNGRDCEGKRARHVPRSANGSGIIVDCFQASVRSLLHSFAHRSSSEWVEWKKLSFHSEAELKSGSRWGIW